MSSPKPLFVHYGIPRTGSSAVRNYLRELSRVIGRGFVTAGADDLVDVSDADFLLMERVVPPRLTAPRAMRFMTTLRDPIDMVISEWRFFRQMGMLPSDLSLADYVAGLPQVSNKQARWLAALLMPETWPLFEPDSATGGPDFMAVEIDEDALLRTAMRAVDDMFVAVGAIDRMSAFLVRITLDFGVTQVLPWWVRVNASAGATDRVIEPEILLDIARRNSVDVALHRMALNRTLLWEDRMKSECPQVIEAIRALEDGSQEIDRQLLAKIGRDAEVR